MRLVSSILLLGCCVFVATADFPWLNPAVPLDVRVSTLVGNMTIDEVASQLIKEAAAIPRLKVPFYSFWLEADHGVAASGRATVFPTSIARAAAFNVELEQAMAAAIGQEARAKHAAKIQTNASDSTDGYAITAYAPVVNLVRDGRWGRSQETYGESPYLSGQLGAVYVDALQHNASVPNYLQVSACAKHFVAYDLDSNFALGGHNGNYRLQFNANVSTADFYQTYTPMFQDLVDAGVATVMCSYNAVNGTPMCASPLLQSDLRGRLNFSGSVFSDGGAVHDIFSQHNFTKDLPSAAAAAMNAGVDMNSGGKGSDFGYDHILTALDQGLVSESQLRTAASRLFNLRIRLGQLDPFDDVPFNHIPMSAVDSPAHRELAVQYAKESIVLLKNDNSLLPLPVQSGTTSVAVIGPNANRTAAVLANYAGCRDGFDGPIAPTCSLVTPWAGIKARVTAYGGTASLTAGSGLNSTIQGGVEDAIKAASQATHVVLVLGLSTSGAGNDVVLEAEAHDRSVLELPAAQEDLLKAVCAAVDTNITVVFMNGGPISSVFAASNPCVGAVVEAWYGGEEAGTALAAVLFGDLSPIGKLPITVPVSTAQLPAYTSLDLGLTPGRTFRYLEQPPLWAFGFGLKYGSVTYDYLDVTVGSNGVVSVDVTVSANGKYCLDETVMVFAGLVTTDRFDGERSVPLMDLVAFTRVGGLCVFGGGDPVHIEFPVERLALVDTDGTYGVIKGTYNVWVGGRAPGSPGKYVVDTDPLVPPAPLHTTISIH